MSEIRVGYFLEDVAQQQFIVAIVQQVAINVGLDAAALTPEVRNASGGKGKAMTELKQFLRDMAKGLISPPPILVIAIDGNCQGYTEKQKEIRQQAEKYEYPGHLICATPDPHIERWYMADPICFQQVTGSSHLPEVPAYKCERGRYKKAMSEAMQRGSPLGGVEFGAEIAQAMDMYKAQQADPALRHFIDQLKEAFNPFTL